MDIPCSPLKKDNGVLHRRVKVTAIAAIARMIPAMALMAIFPVFFLTRNKETHPRITARIAKREVRIIQLRMPAIRLPMPAQFLLRFPAGAGAGEVTAVGTGATGTAASRATVCCRLRGFPQFLQNRFVSGFWVPHSPQNICHLRVTGFTIPLCHYELPPVLEPLATRW
jgi:hypothetical protein